MSYPIVQQTKNAILEIARLQVGVIEFPANSNRCKYNEWYYGKNVSGASYPWCMVFVQWVFNEAGFSLFRTASCSTLLNQYRKYSPDQVIKSGFKAGDILLYDFSGNRKKTEHTGICIGTNGNYVLAIEGNTGATSETNGGAVCQRQRDPKYITCAIRPNYKE